MVRNSKISKKILKEILKAFCCDISATQTSEFLSINRNTINRYFNIFREKILKFTTKEMGMISGEIELDESYFGAKRVRGKRGRGAAGKTPVFGVLKRNGKVFVTVVKDCSKAELLPIIQGKILEGSTIHTDGWKAYDGLILNGYDHYRVHHSANEFARGKCHVNGIESFWSFAKRRLTKFNGIASHRFILHLKECEFRFNYRNQNIYDKMLEVIKIV
jgi:transposase